MSLLLEFKAIIIIRYFVADVLSISNDTYHLLISPNFDWIAAVVAKLIRGNILDLVGLVIFNGIIELILNVLKKFD